MLNDDDSDIQDDDNFLMRTFAGDHVLNVEEDDNFHIAFSYDQNPFRVFGEDHDNLQMQFNAFYENEDNLDFDPHDFFEDDDDDDDDYYDDDDYFPYGDDDPNDESDWSDEWDLILGEYRSRSDQEDSYIKSIQDSHVLSGFYFGGKRNPFLQNFDDDKRGYETCLKLIEELDLLCKTWKRRTTHSFTAHIQKWQMDREQQNRQKASTSSIALGCSESDFDTDIDDEPPLLSQESTNHLLTKRKYCQSTRVFFKVFETGANFDHFMAYIRRVKKHVLNVAFSQFLNSIPEEIVRKLPDEVWIKIWKYSSVEPSSMRHSFPSGDTKYYMVEQFRVTDLYASLVNVYVIVLEVLFKRYKFLKMHPMDQIKDSFFKDNFIRNHFWRYYRVFQSKFHRLLDFENFYQNNSGEEDVGDNVDDGDSKDIGFRLSHGRFTIDKVAIPVNQYRKYLRHRDDDEPSRAFFQASLWNYSKNVFANQIPNGLIAILLSVDERVQFLIWNLQTKSQVAIIKTSVYYVDYVTCYDFGYDIVCLYDHRLSFTFRYENVIKTFQWTFGERAGNGRQVLLPDKKPIVQSVPASSLSSSIVMQTVTEFDGKHRLVLLYNSSPSFELKIICCESKKILNEYTFKNQTIELKGAKGDKALFVVRSMDVVIFFDLKDCRILGTCDLDSEEGIYCEKVVSELNVSDSEENSGSSAENRNETLESSQNVIENTGNSDENLDAEQVPSISVEIPTVSFSIKNKSLVTAVFDADPDVKRFIILQENFKKYLVIDFSDTELKVVTYQGLNQGLVEEFIVHLDEFLFYNGMLFYNRMSEHAGTGHYSPDRTLEFKYFDILENDAPRMISTFYSTYDAQLYEEAFLGIKVFPKIAANWCKTHKPFLISPKKIVAAHSDDGIIILDLTGTGSDVIERELQTLQTIKESQERFKKEIRQLALKQFLNLSVRLEGRIIQWKDTYGFIKPFNNENLGNIFVHQSEFAPKHRKKKKLLIGRKLSFQIVTGNKSWQVKATKVKFL